ncbi:MAG: hypothetical protein RIB93_22210 [Coleofasciculus sp. D1-CHI-01]|jgi:hypothetical protein|uniref:hypothetical protein n=2 Tax=Coleofasciculaceae TaxID=1892251 RepID=UPI0002D79EA0|nr:hypothetical protein [Coleofasciculus chthonoplastes]
MADQHSPANYTSADLEKAALSRFRSLISFLPKNCKLFRELWNRSTVLCLDFENCPNLLDQVMGQSFLLLLVAHYLGLADSVLFRRGKKVMGWMTMMT